MTIPHLINDNGVPFGSSEMKRLNGELDALGDDERVDYRNQNASAIAQHEAAKFLIVSGPGTGKSHLFLNKINNWYQKDPDAGVFVTSFVRKLVADLQNDIETDQGLADEQKRKITASTLHKFARSVVEINHGTTQWPFKPHFKIIAQFWKDVIWSDVLAHFPTVDRGSYPWKKFEEQLHNNSFIKSGEWVKIKETYYALCKFYNAAGFADLILRAAEALKEKPTLNEDKYFIIDEYQDFNLAEEALINQLVANSSGLLVVGDDEQVLYEKLKAGKATLIRDLYNNKDFVNGMLPFCGRSSHHITKTAAHFIQQHRESECIEKIYLPIKSIDDKSKVQVIACATPATAVNYIEKFVADNKTEIDERKMKLEAGEEKDAFLLILTPAKEINFYKQDKEGISKIVSEYKTEVRSFSEDYYQLLSYYSLGNYIHDNFTLRKVLDYEKIPVDKVHKFLVQAMQDGKDLCDLDFQEIKGILNSCKRIKTIVEGNTTTPEIVEEISKLISLTNKEYLQNEIELKGISKKNVKTREHEEEEDAELEEIEVKRMGAVELMTLAGSKGLSADHVIIVGFDNVNMGFITKNAFYVAITRARKSLHILTALKSGGAKESHSFLDQLPEEHTEYYSYKKGGQTQTGLSGKKDFKKYLQSLNYYKAKNLPKRKGPN